MSSEPNDKKPHQSPSGLLGGQRQQPYGAGPSSGRKRSIGSAAEARGGWGSPAAAGRFGHFAKYTKPKIGSNYQCAVPAWEDPARQQQAADAEGEASSASNATAEAAGRATRRRGTR